jgi:lipopolysaccharide/colanic/teichoic acid biosynthesis glycosyltransferase
MSLFSAATLDLERTRRGQDQSAIAPAYVSAGRLARRAVQGLLIAGDGCAYALAGLTVLWLAPAGTDGGVLGRILVLSALAVIVLCASRSLYPGYRILAHERLRRRVMVSAQVAALAMAGVLLLPNGMRLALPLAAFLALGMVAQSVLHALASRLCRWLGIWGERAAIVADADCTAALTAHFIRHWQLGIRPEPVPLQAAPAGQPLIALVADDTSLEALAGLRERFTEILILADTPTLKLTGLHHAAMAGQVGLRLTAAGGKNPDVVRRALDLAIAIPAAILLAPLVLGAAIAIHLFDPGPAFFWHEREGRGGRRLRVLKLRTMYRDAEQRLEAVLRDNPEMRAEWLSHFKLRHDPRILPVIGHLLRKTSLDELPQLYNIIAGDMTLVGPRPFPAYHLSAMDSAFRAKRHSVMPGLTGLWQISERSEADIGLQQQLDEFYIDNRSPWLDWHILVSTIPAVFRRGGAW